MRADIRADLPRVRASPLSWMFPLAFVIHGAAPGGVLFGLSLGGVIPSPWSYAGIILGVPLALGGGGLLVWIAVRSRARIERMRAAAAGPSVQATVVHAEVGLGSFRSRRAGQSTVSGRKVELTLALWSPTGGSYQVSQSSYFLTEELAGLRPGGQLWVNIHPHDPLLVFVPYCGSASVPHQRSGGPPARQLS